MVDQVKPENVRYENKNLGISGKEDIIMIVTDHK